MRNHHQIPRRSVLVGIIPAFLTARFAAHAQSSAQLTPQKLQRIIDLALKSRDETRVGAGGTVGLPDAGANTKQASFQENDVLYILAVIVPRQADGLIFIARSLKVVVARIHRTDTHLRRVASARIEGGIVSEWTGGECDADFAAQLAAWSKRDF